MGRSFKMQRYFVLFYFFATFLWVGILRADSVYSMQALAPLGKQVAGVSTLNGSGAAVGFYTDAAGVQDAALFNGAITKMGSDGAAYGINDSGTVVGVTYSSNGPRVTEWSGPMQTSLGIAGYGMAISNSGEIVGGYQTSGQTHAFSYTSGSIKDLGTLGGSFSTAYAINNSGQIAGTGTLGNGNFRAFSSNGSSLVNLGTLGGANSYGMAISQNGFIAGSSQNGAGYLNAFLWTAAGLQDLGTLGGSISTAQGVNDSGWIVGSSTTAAGVFDGFLYRDGAMTDLNSFVPIGSDWTITGASGINNAGQILATASGDGQSWAVEFDPTMLSRPVSSVAATPEPGAFFLAAVGTLILLGGAVTRSKLPNSRWTVPMRRAAHVSSSPRKA